MFKPTKALAALTAGLLALSACGGGGGGGSSSKELKLWHYEGPRTAPWGWRGTRRSRSSNRPIRA